MLSRYGVFVCILFLFSGLTACDSVEPEDMLTEQEVDALFTAIGAGFQALGTDSVVDDAAFGALPDENTPVNPEDLLSGLPVDTTYACPDGGSMNLQGTIMPGAPDDEGLALNYDFLFVPSGCVVTVESTTFTLNSQSGMREQGMIFQGFSEGDDGVTIAVAATSTSMGMVDWELDDRSGMCDIDLSTDITVSLTVGSDPDADILIFVDTDVEGGTSGTLCDIEVNRPAELPEDPEVLLPPDATSL